jgi:hypothetical protein
MIVVAHVGGVPLEELLPSVGGAGASLLLARGWLILHLRRRRKSRDLSAAAARAVPALETEGR